MTQLSKALFRSAESRYFRNGERCVALEWLGRGRVTRIARPG